MTGVDIDDLRVVTADDVDLAVLHRRVREPVATVVVVHGFTAHRSHPEIVALVEALGGDDVDIVTYDGRGHGRSGGESTLGDRERHDVAAAVSVARTDTPVVLVGVSMGGAAVLGYLDERPPGSPEIAGLLLISSPSRWQAKPSFVTAYVTFITRTAPGRMLARYHPGVRIAKGLRLPTPPRERISRVSVPVWIVHGRADRLLDPAAADELHAAAAGPARLDLVDGMGHALREPGLAAARRGLDWILAGAAHDDGG
ncbi:MAG: alpha/beta fold hydrolase [Acidimicrobiales bacterium]